MPLFATTIPIVSPCPHHLCDCGRTRELSHPTLPTITKSDRPEILGHIEDIHSIEDFERARQALREVFGIIFLIQGNGIVRVTKRLGLCRLVRGSVESKIKSIFDEDMDFLIALLNRSSLFNQEERE